MIRQQVHDKNWIEKPVTVNPVMDKVFPEEKTMNFYQLTLGGTAKENQFSKLSEVSNNKDNRNKGESPNGLTDSRYSNPFRTMDQRNDQSFQDDNQSSQVPFQPLRNKNTVNERTYSPGSIQSSEFYNQRSNQN